MDGSCNVEQQVVGVDTEGSAAVEKMPATDDRVTANNNNNNNTATAHQGHKEQVQDLSNLLTPSQRISKLEAQDNEEAKNGPLSLDPKIQRGVSETSAIMNVQKSEAKNDLVTKLEVTNLSNDSGVNENGASNGAIDQVGKEAIEAKDDDNEGDPILSGTGQVSRECSASELTDWSEILPRWHSKLSQRPKGLDQLVRRGVPEPLRGEVWQLLSGAHQCSDLMEQYRIFLTKSVPAEQIILRDINRTYPGHENFRSDAGPNSLVESLFKVCKAYAVLDSEVGYCQGLSFLVASLLLHMPEEQAFCVFVRIMQHYGLRDMFRNNFDELYLKFFQLERLLEDHMPDLYQHFSLIGIETFQYASQWFLVIFTAKFPLNAVFYIMDVFLLHGMETVFQIALALLGASKQELLALDFEGVLKFFRVQMPKRYQNEENVQQLIKAAAEVNLKKLKTYAKDYKQMKQRERQLESPLTRLQCENIKLTETMVRLENENDGLARDLVASKVQLRFQIDALEDRADTLNRALSYSRQDCQSYMSTISDMEDERARLEVEVSQLKEVCRRELQRTETESKRDAKIIEDYKKICSQLSKRLEYRLLCAKQFVESVQDLLRDNESCGGRKCLEMFSLKADELMGKFSADNVEETITSATTTTDTDATTNSNSNRTKLLQRKASSESDYNNRLVGAYVKSSNDSQATSSEVKIKQLTEHIDELEVELARTKLALVESECERQQLAHDLSPQQSSSNNNNNNSPASKLSHKLESVKATMPSSVSARSKPAQMSPGSGTFSRLNYLISSKISNMSQVYSPLAANITNNPTSSIPNSISTPTLATKDAAGWSGGGKSNRTPANSNTFYGLNQSIDESEHPC